MRKANELRKELISNPKRHDAIAVAKKFVEEHIEYAFSDNQSSTTIYSLESFPCDGYHGKGEEFNIIDDIVRWLMDLGYIVTTQRFCHGQRLRHVVSW